MAENYDDIDKNVPDVTDADDNAEDDKDKDDEYEKYCYLCRRPESVAGKLIHMPGDINICADCMQRSFDSFNNSGFGNMPGLGNMQFIDLTNMPFGNIDMSKFKAQNDVPKSQKVKKKAPKEKKAEPEMVQWEFDFEDKKEPEPIRVKASREPVKSVQRETDDADSSIHVIKDSDHDDKMRRFGDRTPVRLEESITDASAKGSDSDKNGRPDFRIGGRISDAYDDVDDGVV